MYDSVGSQDCIYVTVIEYMYFCNDCEIHFSITVTASLFGCKTGNMEHMTASTVFSWKLKTPPAPSHLKQVHLWKSDWLAASVDWHFPP